MYKIKYSTRKMDLEGVGCGGMDLIDLARIGTGGGHL